MATPHQVFTVRLALDAMRQPGHAVVLDGLGSYIDAHPSPDASPYSLSWPERKVLRNVKGYLARPNGPPCRFKGRYLYRLQSLHGLYRLHRATSGRTAKAEHRQIMREAGGDALTWRPLNNLIDEFLVGTGGVTWWGALDLTALGTIQEGALRIGLPLSWLHPESIVMRYPLASTISTSAFHVPSVLEGFESPIFLAASADSDNDSGTTIDLTTPKRLKLGMPEMVIGPTPVDKIEFVPVLIDRQITSTYGPEFKLRDDSPLWSHLNRFYQSQLQPAAT